MGTDTVPIVDVVQVQVIIPVHNAADTLHATIQSTLCQVPSPQSSPIHAESNHENHNHKRVRRTNSIIRMDVCCYDDGSTDESWKILQEIVASQNRQQQHHRQQHPWIETHLHITQSPDGVSRGAGYARNRAVDLVSCPSSSPQKIHDDNDEIATEWTEHHDSHHHHFLCWLDADDIMEPTRVSTQVAYLLSMPNHERGRTMLGSRFTRDPVDATMHYSNWANNTLLNHDRIMLERFREITVIQPTWMMERKWFHRLGGYLEAPLSDKESSAATLAQFLKRALDPTNEQPPHWRLVHPSETLTSLRLAEDLRLFHAHLAQGGLLRRCDDSLVIYRHPTKALRNDGISSSSLSSQSSLTSRKLLLQLRAMAFTKTILQQHPVEVKSKWEKFIIWGAGRDGRDLIKALAPDVRNRIYCMVDVDHGKIQLGHYHNPRLKFKIPILHFSFLIRDRLKRDEMTQAWREGRADVHFGRIEKNNHDVLLNVCAQEVSPLSSMRDATLPRRLVTYSHELSDSFLQKLPVVVCVAMYRTNGALENNVKLIGRTEGVDLWHFS